MVAPSFSFLEFFAGGGMARMGLAQHFDCVFANENDRKKCNTYKANFGDDHLIEADIETLHAGDLPSADLAWASFPCQDLSLAGNRGGMTSARSGTFWAFWRLITDLRQTSRAPRLIVIENVTGLLTSHSGRDFAAIVNAFGAAGYCIGGVILDAADFVPQSRPRLFLVGWDRSMDGPDAGKAEHNPLLARAVAGLSEADREHWRSLDLPAPLQRNMDLAAIIDQNPPASAWRSDADLSKLLDQMTPLHRARVDAAVKAGALQVGAVYRRIRKGVQRAEVRYDGLAGCLRTLKGGSSRQLLLVSEHGKLGLRPMLAREAADLMGLPASYQLPKSTTAAISLCGDGVCVPVVAWLSTHVLAPLLQQNQLIDQSRKRIDVY